MAPSQMDQQQEQSLSQGYTHKKFNCGYSHKKLGLRLRPRIQVNKENIIDPQPKAQPEAKQVNENKSSKATLFRPYALHDNTPRKRRMSRSTETNEDNCYSNINTSQDNFYLNTPQISSPENQGYLVKFPIVSSPPPASVQYCSSPPLSPNSYSLRLQRQRAALYMRYLAQFQQLHAAATLYSATGYPMGYPNVTAPIFNGC